MLLRKLRLLPQSVASGAPFEPDAGGGVSALTQGDDAIATFLNHGFRYSMEQLANRDRAALFQTLHEGLGQSAEEYGSSESDMAMAMGIQEGGASSEVDV